MLVTSDIPVNVSFEDSALILCLSLLFFIVYGFYIRNTKYILLNIMLLMLPLFFLFMVMEQSLKHPYPKHDTVAGIIGFFSIFFSFLQLIYLKRRKAI